MFTEETPRGDTVMCAWKVSEQHALMHAQSLYYLRHSVLQNNHAWPVLGQSLPMFTNIPDTQEYE